MTWGFFLHFYQPYNQQLDILERIVNESYRKVIGGLSLNPNMKITININAGLVELLANNGYMDVIEDIKSFAQRGQIEFTGGVKYHPFLPLLPRNEIKRQIELNEKTNKKYFGASWKPQGFFSPELGLSFKVAEAAKEAGFQWIIAEELASPKKPDFKSIYTIKGLDNFKIIFRDKRISVLILSAIARSARSFIEEIGKDELEKDRYLLTMMDTETFGHHRPGLENLLFQIYNDKKIKKVFVSELVKEFGIDKEIELRDSTWSSEEQDFYLEKEKQHSFTLWSHPENPIHHLQWEFTHFVIDLVHKLDTKAPYYKEAREKLDKALQSDQFWWASAKPWWSLEMIEAGAFLLKDIVFSIPDISKNKKDKAHEYYRQIIDLAFEWQRSGKIRHAYREAYGTVHRRPYKKRVFSGQFNAMILEFEDEMNKAVKAQEFEKAIKWRDAIYKLKNEMDIYDVLHIVDDLARSRKLPSLKDYWEHDIGEFSIFAKKHFKAFKPKEFVKKQPQQLFREVKAVYYKKQMGHPLGFFRDEYNSFYLCEVPSEFIEHLPGESGWDAMSVARFPKSGTYHRPGQCKYELRSKKLKITITPSSLLHKFIKLVKQDDENKGTWLKIAVLAEANRWSPVFFKNLTVVIPYRISRTGQARPPVGQGFKFKISGFTPKEKK
ncbi:UvrB/UvrC motif-containing protein [Patescibacteria group bacterium AH-259-L05]|nr:UvrB/UvrC motif-containing protein [Patescibacteria group bacterium AH-259-L05]